MTTPRLAVTATSTASGAVMTHASTTDPDAELMRKRKLIETTFGWAKQYCGLRRMMCRGLDRVSARVIFTMTVFSMLRISHLVPEPTG